MHFANGETRGSEDISAAKEEENVSHVGVPLVMALAARARSAEKLVGPFARWMHRMSLPPQALCTSLRSRGGAGHVCATSEHRKRTNEPVRTYDL